MEVEREIKVNHEMNAVFKIFSDPCFLIPKIFPYVKYIECRGDEFKGNGGLPVLGKYDFKGRVYVGDLRIRYIYNSTKGNGILEVEKVDVNAIKLRLEHDNSLSFSIAKPILSYNFRRMEEKLDEQIRIERIKRKI